MIWRRLPSFCNLTIFWVVISWVLSEYFIVTSLKLRSDDKHYKTSLKWRFGGVWQHLEISRILCRNRVKREFYSKGSKMSFLWQGLLDQLRKMIQVACDSILQIGHLLDRNVVNWGFYHRSSKCFSDDRHHKPTWEWWFRGVWQCIANSSFFGWWWY